MAPYELGITRRWWQRKHPEYLYEVEVLLRDTVIETVRIRARDEYEARYWAVRFVAAYLYSKGVKLIPAHEEF